MNVTLNAVHLQELKIPRNVMTDVKERIFMAEGLSCSYSLLVELTPVVSQQPR